MVVSSAHISCNTWALSACREQKCAPDPLGLELQKIVSLVLGNELVSWKSSHCSQLLNHLSRPTYPFSRDEVHSNFPLLNIFYKKGDIKVSFTSYSPYSSIHQSTIWPVSIVFYNLSSLPEAGGCKVQGLSRILSKFQACFEKLENLSGNIKFFL